MESRFSKYETSGKATSNHIANINSFIDWNFETGLDLIEKEIIDLNGRIDKMGESAPPMFPQKVKKLLALGKCIEDIHETYHFNKDSKEN